MPDLPPKILEVTGDQQEARAPDQYDTCGSILDEPDRTVATVCCGNPPCRGAT